MTRSPFEVIHGALHTHDSDGPFWLGQITALLNDPANHRHKKALEIVKVYVENLLRAASGGLNEKVSDPPEAPQS